MLIYILIVVTAAIFGTSKRLEKYKMFERFQWFERFPSIKPDATRYIKKIIPNHQQIVVVEEKVDGSNICFVFVISERLVHICSRNKQLGPEEDIFNAKESVLTPMIPRLQPLVDRLVETYPETIICVNIYGELFGNGINGRVFYSKVQHWMAFEIKITVESGASSFLSFDEKTNLFVEFGILHSRSLYKGPYSEVSKNFDVDNFHTTLPGILGETVRDGITDIGEGIVIRSIDGGRELKILKKKSKKFKDIESGGERKKTVEVGGVGDYQSVIDDVKCYLTHARLTDVLSKLTDGEKTNINKVFGELLKDAMDEYIENLHEDKKSIFQMIYKSEKKSINISLYNHIKEKFKESDTQQ